jgi:hypothetical protein
MAVALGSFFWIYEVTSDSLFRPRKRDRRAGIRPQTYDRRNPSENAMWCTAKYWVHRIMWLFVMVMMLIDFVVTFGPRVGLT